MSEIAALEQNIEGRTTKNTKFWVHSGELGGEGAECALTRGTVLNAGKCFMGRGSFLKDPWFDPLGLLSCAGVHQSQGSRPGAAFPATATSSPTQTGESKEENDLPEVLSVLHTQVFLSKTHGFCASPLVLSALAREVTHCVGTQLHPQPIQCPLYEKLFLSLCSCEFVTF